MVGDREKRKGNLGGNMKTYLLVLFFIVSCISSNFVFANDVVGEVQFGTQCVFGSVSDPVRVPLELWTPAGHSTKLFKLHDSIGVFYLYADCKKKLIDVRASNLSIVMSGEAMPDGSFMFRLPALELAFQSDGGYCNASFTLNFFGQLECGNMDEPIIKLETGWLPNESSEPSVKCDFPPRPYLHSSVQLHQCH
jgi:hypothetical protein